MKNAQSNLNKTLIKQINRKNWWHSLPTDRNAYKKRGIFLASSYKECSFYGRPLNEPIKVRLSNSLINTEENIIEILFGEDSAQMKAYKSLVSYTAKDILKTRFKLDAAIYKTAKKKGYDSIAIVTTEGFKGLKDGKMPQSVELNIFEINKTSLHSDSICLTMPPLGGVSV